MIAASFAASPEAFGSQRLRPAQRLRSSTLFEEAYAGGRRFVGRRMVLWLRAGPDAALRLGVVTGRRLGKAVVRNRARRRLRELFRRHRSRLSGAVDVVLVARAGCAEVPWPELTAEFLALAARAGLLRDAESRSER